MAHKRISWWAQKPFSTSTRLIFVSWLMSFVLTVFAVPAGAGITITITESGGNVVATLSGTFNTGALAFATSNRGVGNQDYFYPSGGRTAFSVESDNSSRGDIYMAAIGDPFPVYGSGGFGEWDSSSGDLFMIVSSAGTPSFNFPVGYAGEALSATGTKNGATISSLGMTPGTYVATYGSGTTDTITHVISAATDTDGNVTAGASAEPTTIPTTVDTLGEALQVLDFAISDGGGGDGLALDVTAINVQIGGSFPTSELDKLTYVLNGPDVINASGVISSRTVTFGSLSISVADGASEEYRLSVYYSAAASDVIDNTSIFFTVDGDSDFTVVASGTQMGATNTVNSGNMTSAVEATRLIFAQQPAGSVSGSALSTQPIVAAVDALGNRDTNFSEIVTLTTAAAGALTNASLQASGGFAEFPDSSVTYTATADQQAFTLVANDEDGVGTDLGPVTSNAIVSDVVATQLVFGVEPAPALVTSGQATSISTAPLIQAVDASLVVDTGYATAITLSEINGGGTAIISGTGDSDGSPNTVTLAPSSGAASFSGLEVNYSPSGALPETFNLSATSGGLASATSVQLTAAAVPDAPTGVTATAGNALASVSWTKPADNGSTITGYTVTAVEDITKQCTTSDADTVTCDVTGLTNGTPYTFTVTATNSVGTSPASAASSPVTPAAVPDAPTGVTATAGNALASVSWTKPADNGSTITGYTVTAVEDNTKQCTTSDADTVTCDVTGLTNGTPYTFTVTATNSVGTSPASAASSPVTPVSVPDAPTGVTATAGNALASVSWTKPADNGSTITGYTVTAVEDNTKQCTTSDADTVTCDVTGLTNGTPYTFTVTATNSVGTSPASAASSPVTPAADTDEDGIPDNQDEFPQDPAETTDTDGDGIGDNGDAGGAGIGIKLVGVPNGCGFNGPVANSASFLNTAPGQPLDKQLSFEITNCGNSVTIQALFGTDLPAGSVAYKISTAGEWTQLPGATISGNSVTYTIVDNGPFDENPALGVIADPVTVVVPSAPTAAPATSIPVLPWFALVSLGALVGLFGARRGGQLSR